MKIVCRITVAAAEVLGILLSANLRPGNAFRVTGPLPPATPVHITLSTAPPDDLVKQLQAIPDTAIVTEETV